MSTDLASPLDNFAADQEEAARRIVELASHIEKRAAATEPRDKAARTRAINVLSREAKHLQRRNAADV